MGGSYACFVRLADRVELSENVMAEVTEGDGLVGVLETTVKWVYNVLKRIRNSSCGPLWKR